MRYLREGSDADPCHSKLRRPPANCRRIALCPDGAAPAPFIKRGIDKERSLPLKIKCMDVLVRRNLIPTQTYRGVAEMNPNATLRTFSSSRLLISVLKSQRVFLYQKGQELSRLQDREAALYPFAVRSKIKL